MRTQQDFILGHTRSSCCCSMVYKCDFICLPQLQLPPLLPHGIQVTSIRRGHSCMESDLLLTECGSGVLRPAFPGHPVQFCETERMKRRAGTWLYLPALLLTAAYHLQGICSVLASGRWSLNVSSRAHWGPRGTGLEAQAGVYPQIAAGQYSPKCLDCCLLPNNRIHFSNWKNIRKYLS